MAKMLFSFSRRSKRTYPISISPRDMIQNGSKATLDTLEWNQLSCSPTPISLLFWEAYLAEGEFLHVKISSESLIAI